jgi:hypothetical protein
MCLKLIEEIEKMKRAKIKPVKVEKRADELELQSIWLQLLKWLIVNEVDKAVRSSQGSGL